VCKVNQPQAKFFLRVLCWDDFPSLATLPRTDTCSACPSGWEVPDGGNCPNTGEFTGWPQQEPAVKVTGHWTGLKGSTGIAVLFERFRLQIFKFRGTLTGEEKSAQWGFHAPGRVNRIRLTGWNQRWRSKMKTEEGTDNEQSEAQPKVQMNSSASVCTPAK